MDFVPTARRRILHLLSESVYDNAVVTKEFRTRMRGWKAFLTMGGYVLFLTAVMMIAYYSISAAQSNGGVYAALVGRDIGLRLFSTLTWTQTILLLFIIPALTSGAISMELEKRTIEMIALTRLTPGKVVIGKQLSGFLFSLILLVSSLPLAGICLMLGGISPAEIAATYAIMVAWTFMFAAIGVFWSSLFTRTATAALLSYATCGAHVLITGIIRTWFGYISLGYSAMMSGARQPSVMAFSALNPGSSAYLGVQSAKICGLLIPIWSLSTVLNVAMGMLLLYVACMHVRHHRCDRSLQVKLFILGITAALVWIFVGDKMGLIMGSSTPRGMEASSIIAMILFPVLAIGAAIFATGRITKAADRSFLGYVFSPLKVFKGDLGGGIIFMLLWTAIAYAVYGLAYLWADHAYLMSMPGGFWRAYYHVGAVVLSVVFAFSAIGAAASSFAGSRGAAAALVILFAIIVFVGYACVAASYIQGVSSSSSLIWKLGAFWPPSALYTEAGTPATAWSSPHDWLTNSIFYLVLGMSCIMLASRRPINPKSLIEE